MMARFRYFDSLLKVKIRVKKRQKGATRGKQVQRFIKLKNILVLGALLSSHKKKYPGLYRPLGSIKDEPNLNLSSDLRRLIVTCCLPTIE